MQNHEPHLTVENSSNLFRWRTYLYLGFLLAAITVFDLATLREGHLWGDDFAMYIHHAHNIAQGRPYADTGYVYNPAVPVYGPRMYPPVFPLLLAPLYKVFGFSLIPMKVEQVVFIVLMLATVFMLWHRELGTGYSLALVAILGLSPNFWSAKDSILSDLPFLFFFYVAVILLRWKPQSEKQGWTWSVLLGLTLYLAIGTRTAGVTLVPGVLLHQWFRTKRINRLTWIALILCATALIAQNWVVGTVPGGYLEQLHSTTPKTMLLNVLRYSRALAGSWVGWVRNPFSYFLLAVIAVLTLVGFRSQRRNGVAAIECVLVPYLILMVLWPFGAGIRYALPFVPWITFLALSGLHELSCPFKLRYLQPHLADFCCSLLYQQLRPTARATSAPFARTPAFPNSINFARRCATRPALRTSSSTTGHVLSRCTPVEGLPRTTNTAHKRNSGATRGKFTPPTSSRQTHSMKMVGSLLDM